MLDFFVLKSGSFQLYLNLCGWRFKHYLTFSKVILFLELFNEPFLHFISYVLVTNNVFFYTICLDA